MPQKILAIIPARGGSKGIKNKNIKPFNGKPLIAYAIAAAQNSKLINKIVVSTESEAIAQIAKKLGAEVPFLRPKKLARDNSLVKDAVLHLLKTLKEEYHYQPDYIVLLEPTSPLRLAKDIDNALSLLFSRKAGALVSVYVTEQLLFIKDKLAKLKIVSSKKFLKSTNRQQLPPTYKFDGFVYAVKTEVFLKEKTFLPKGVIGYVNEDRWRTVDLNEPQDFILGELICKNIKNIEKKIINFK
jgi:N-acylneuraminate cytidylyltransferase/CMP-N,N'-diacetyllegionaminic acid synthase